MSGLIFVVSLSVLNVYRIFVTAGILCDQQGIEIMLVHSSKHESIDEAKFYILV